MRTMAIWLYLGFGLMVAYLAISKVAPILSTVGSHLIVG